jgi:hypothetical protein
MGRALTLERQTICWGNEVHELATSSAAASERLGRIHCAFGPCFARAVVHQEKASCCVVQEIEQCCAGAVPRGGRSRCDES